MSKLFNKNIFDLWEWFLLVAGHILKSNEIGENEPNGAASESEEFTRPSVSQRVIKTVLKVPLFVPPTTQTSSMCGLSRFLY